MNNYTYVNTNNLIINKTDMFIKRNYSSNKLNNLFELSKSYTEFTSVNVDR